MKKTIIENKYCGYSGEVWQGGIPANLRWQRGGSWGSIVCDGCGRRIHLRASLIGNYPMIARHKKRKPT